MKLKLSIVNGMTFSHTVSLLVVISNSFSYMRHKGNTSPRGISIN